MRGIGSNGQALVYIVRCVYQIAFAGLGGRGIFDMTCQ